MPDLFLSYARDDQDIARRFAENLKREGFDVWWDQALNPGEAFDQVTEEALAAASAVIVLWSKTSVSSRWVRAEATQANANHRLVPVMIEPCTRPIMFELTHTADLAQWRGNCDDPAWLAFVASVHRFVQRQSGAGAAVDPERLAPPKPTLQERLAAAGTALWAAAKWTGSLLRRFGLRLAFGIACAALAAYVTWQVRPQVAHEVTRFSIPLPLSAGQGTGLALSPDGRRVVYQDGRNLVSRRLDQDEQIRIPGIEDAATLPFFSPDSRSLAFFTSDKTGNKLKAFDFSGEATRVLADIKDATGLLGSWDRQGHIYFDKAGPLGLYQVPAVGGVPEEVAPPGDYPVLRYPQALPGGRWVMCTGFMGTIAGGFSDSDILVHNVATGERKVVLKGGHFARYVPTGHLLFARNGTLFAVAFDLQHLVARGREVPVVQGMLTDEGNGFAAYDVSENGTLVYQSGTVNGQSGKVRNVVRADRTGAMTVISAETRNYSSPRASPDGSRIAVEVTEEDGRVHIWVMDAKSGAATQLTFEGDEDRYPLWTADGRDVLYTSRRGKEHTVWRKAADGSGTARQVVAGTEALTATDVHGRTLIYHERGDGEQRDLFALDLDAGGKPRTLLATPDDEVGGRVSPDGAWIAYVLTPKGGGTAGRRVYVRPYPDTASGGQRAVSNGQGAGVEWSPAGDEIFYSVNGGPTPLMATPVTKTSNTLTPGAPRELFSLGSRLLFTQTGGTYRFGYTYEVLPGRNQILGVAAATAPAASAGEAGSTVQPHLNVVLNWFEELKKLVPVE